MNNFYIYIGMAVAAILVLFLVFKPEFSMNGTGDNLYVLGYTETPVGVRTQVEPTLKENYLNTLVNGEGDLSADKIIDVRILRSGAALQPHVRATVVRDFVGRYREKAEKAKALNLKKIKYIV